jgi:glycosyltransferase involved in cell wall biosynthesis
MFVFPTLYETFSLVAYEAAATGIPLIATGVSGIRDLLQDDAAGLMVERNAGDVARGLVALWRDEDLRRSLGAMGQMRVRQYTWDRTEQTVRALYTELLQGAEACAR